MCDGSLTSRFSWSQSTASWAADSNGLSQLIDRVLPKSPEAAICATVRSSMNMNSMYGCSARLISYSANTPAV